MGNANEEVKIKSNYITDTSANDGVAKAIDKFILSAFNNLFKLRIQLLYYV
ncbi:MAG: hypothetical protein K0R54_2410 [Clostridiaceae bacterium]|jgi:hydroxymethylpyrimidine pyrophosphatase-like HAD family hydrolase|nr:hypothetical protein [Clostridiaceae bacterium]